MSRELDLSRLDDVCYLARTKPPFGGLQRFGIKLGYGFWWSSRESVILLEYEDALRTHKIELLARPDLRREVRRYVGKHIR